MGPCVCVPFSLVCFVTFFFSGEGSRAATHAQRQTRVDLYHMCVYTVKHWTGNYNDHVRHSYWHPLKNYFSVKSTFFLNPIGSNHFHRIWKYGRTFNADKMFVYCFELVLCSLYSVGGEITIRRQQCQVKSRLLVMMQTARRKTKGRRFTSASVALSLHAHHQRNKRAAAAPFVWPEREEEK
jgi:hypothetical protein